jgi:hypothetical protein
VRTWLFAAILVCVLGCGSGLRVATVAYPHEPVSAEVDRRNTPKVFTGVPQAKHEIIGAIELRSSRPATMAKLVNKLVAAAQEMGADAIMPPVKSTGAAAQSGQHANPFRAYYVQDDGREQLLEANLVRFPRYIYVEGTRHYAGSSEQLSALAARAKSDEGCVPVWIDLPRGPNVIGAFLSADHPFGMRAGSCLYREYAEPPRHTAP